MNTFLSILIAAVFFCLIIIIHELGHFTVAKLCGIRVDEFAIGMGPAIFKKQKGDTLYTIRLLPIGGFCAMGEDEERNTPDSFRQKSVWRRMATIAAG
ncbi:MAG: site-2 protease family protein, partial [Oscillospiraceae bacterium]